MPRKVHDKSRSSGHDLVHVLISKRLVARLAMHAAATGDPLSAVIEDAVTLHLDAVETVPGPTAAALIREVLSS